MAGLLGYQPDPIGNGLLGMGAALMTPRALGGGVGPGLLAFNAGAQQAQQARRQQQQDALREQYLLAQMEEARAQGEERRATAAERARATAAALERQKAQDTFWQQFGGPAPGFRDANIAITGNAPAGYVPPAAGGRVQITPDMVAAAARSGISLDELRKAAEAPDWGRPEVARTIDGADAQGRPTTAQFDRFGNPVGAAIPKAYERRFQDTGGSIGVFDPYTLAQSGAIGKTMTPGDVQQAKDAAASRGVTMRGQNMTDARARELAEATRSGQGEKAPSGFRFNPDGTLAFIPGGPADPATDRAKPPTEAQSKDYLFATRAAAANQIIGGLKSPSVVGAAVNSNLSGLPLIGSSLAAGQNLALSPDTQRYMQAKRDFINAVLRKESGAVIGKDEFDNADKQYFPQPGERDPAVIRQKAEARQRAIDGISVGAGALAGTIRTGAAPAAAAPSGDASITDLVRKYANPR